VAAQPTTSCDRPCVGPSSGSLLLAGGGVLGPDIYERFIALAGGPDAPIVVIPTASADDVFDHDWPGLEELEAAGATNLILLHTRDRGIADSEAFVTPLRKARAVWIAGGRQGRLVDAYLRTRTQREMKALLERGGVIGASSAGASMLASYLVRGAVETNEILMAPGYQEGFGFLLNTAVDQHIIARNRVEDMLQVLQRHPLLLGIGLDEGTALIVQGDRAEVIGRSSVAIYDLWEQDSLYFWLNPGDVYDLGSRALYQRSREDGVAQGERGSG
jgi:cyanophycinase